MGCLIEQWLVLARLIQQLCQVPAGRQGIIVDQSTGSALRQGPEGIPPQLHSLSPTHARRATASVPALVLKPRVIRAEVQNNGERLARVQAGHGCVQGRLGSNAACTPHPEVARVAHVLPVGDHHHLNRIFVRALGVVLDRPHGIVNELVDQAAATVCPRNVQC